MGAPAKYLFDVDFARGAAERRQTPSRSPSTRSSSPKPKHAAHAARLCGRPSRRQGGIRPPHRRGAGAHRRRNRRRSNRALKAIETRLECEAVEVAVAVAQQARAGADGARAVRRNLRAGEPTASVSWSSTPHIAVRINDALYAPRRKSSKKSCASRGFEGRLVVLAERDIAPGDCRIEWADGGVNRDSAAAEAAISEAVTGYIGARRRFADTQRR